MHDFSPRDIAEAAMVRNLAVITWKKLRVEKLEHAGLVRQLNESFETSEYSEIQYDFESHPQPKVLELTRRTRADHISDWKLGFQLFRKFLKQSATVKELDHLQKDAPLAYRFLIDLARKFDIADKDHTYWCKLQSNNSVDEVLDFIPYVANQFLDKYAEQEWVIEHFDALKTMVVEIQEKRLLKFIQFNSAQRVYDDLDRAFYKTLSELRRHQQWRRDMQAIDVTPTKDDE